MRKISPDGTITTVAGDGSLATLANPVAVAVDHDGVLYVGDAGNHRVLKLEQR